MRVGTESHIWKKRGIYMWNQYLYTCSNFLHWNSQKVHVFIDEFAHVTCWLPMKWSDEKIVMIISTEKKSNICCFCGSHWKQTNITYDICVVPVKFDLIGHNQHKNMYASSGTTFSKKQRFNPHFFRITRKIKDDEYLNDVS